MGVKNPGMRVGREAASERSYVNEKSREYGLDAPPWFEEARKAGIKLRMGWKVPVIDEYGNEQN